MVIEAVRCPALYTSETTQRRVQSLPKLPDRRRIFPDQTSAVRDRDPPSVKSEDWGMSAESAHSIFRRIPARMSARAQGKCIETCLPGQEMPYTWYPAGKYGGLRDLSARWRARCRTVCIVCLSASSAGQRRSRRGEDVGGRAARVDADVARDGRKTQEEKVELGAITLHLHLAGLERGGGRRPSGASLSLANFPKAPVETGHVYVVLSTCCVVGSEGKLGLLHCSRPGEDSDVGVDAPRPPPARVKLQKF